MSRYTVLPLCLLLVLASLLMIHSQDSDGTPERGVDPDINVVVNIPENGGRYEAEEGLRINVTLFNLGEDMGSDEGNLSVVIKSEASGEIVKNWIPVPFTGIPSGGNKTIEFSNWTQIFAGRFICNVSALYFNDANMNDNFVEHTFSVWSDQWIGKPKLDPKPLEKIRGNTDTVFEFETKFSYKSLPNWVRIELDGTSFEMVEKDPEDDIPNDGKIFIYRSTLSIGNHVFRIRANVTGFKNLTTPYTYNPWVNLSIKEVAVTPPKGFITTPFIFSLNYGSEKNLAPDRLFADLGFRKINLTAPENSNYLSGNVQFSARVPGTDLIPSPISYTITCETDEDIYEVGPFNLEGPSMKVVNLTGIVRDLDGGPLSDVLVNLEPGSETTTSEDGRYKISTYVGRSFSVTYSKEGYTPRSYEIDLIDDRDINIELEPLPIGGSVTGTISSNIGGELTALEGALVNISSETYWHETTTDVNGSFVIENIPAGTAYVLKISEFRHVDLEIPLTIQDGAISYQNLTLIERDMSISLDPDSEIIPVDLDRTFQLQLPEIPDPSTVEIAIENSTASIGTDVKTDPNSTIIEISPISPLNYHSSYSIKLTEGLRSSSGELLVWRPLTWNFITKMQEPGPFITDPKGDSLNVPLNMTITISLGIGLNHSSVQLSLFNMDVISEGLQLSIEMMDEVDWNSSGRTETWIQIKTDELAYQTRYSLILAPAVKDLYDRFVLEEELEIEFTTENEPDSDGDGFVDSLDAFPEDPDEWSDLDGDGYGDNSDRFPGDPDEHLDTDGDGTGDGSDEDDDGDGMTDEWEIENGFDPKNPQDAFYDADDDGYNNLEEFLENTDPRDKGDHPEEGGQDTGMIIIIGSIILIIILVILVVLFLFGVIGRKKGPAGYEE